MVRVRLSVKVKVCKVRHGQQSSVGEAVVRTQVKLLCAAAAPPPLLYVAAEAQSPLT